MTQDEMMNPSTGEPVIDPTIGAVVRQIEAPWTDSMAQSRLQYRIAVAARQLRAARRRAAEPSWWEWVARVARPLPMGMAAMLLIAALAVLAQPQVAQLSGEVAMTPVPSGSLTVVLAAGAGSEDVLNALIPPTPRDSLLARAFASPVAVGQ